MDPQRLSEIARKHDLELIVQFGSSVAGQMHQGSDVDVAVSYRHAPESYAELGALQADLQALVPDRPVDLGVLEHHFAQRIARSAGLRNRLVHD